MTKAMDIQCLSPAKNLKYYDGSMMDKEFMEAYRLSRKTFYKYKKQLREEDKNGMSYFYNIK